MKINKWLFVAAIALAAAAGAGTQVAVEKVRWTWDDKYEAVNAAPNIHKVLFENDHIRLLEVTIRAGETEPMHGHRYPSVFAYDAPQPRMLSEQLDGSKASVERSLTDIDADLPSCRSMQIQAPHRVTIQDSFQQHFFRLEFKRMDGAAIYKQS